MADFTDKELIRALGEIVSKELTGPEARAHYNKVIAPLLVRLEKSKQELETLTQRLSTFHDYSHNNPFPTINQLHKVQEELNSTLTELDCALEIQGS